MRAGERSTLPDSSKDAARPAHPAGSVGGAPAELLKLQQTAGNRAVTGLVSGRSLQRWGLTEMIKDLVVHQDPWRQLRKLFAKVVEKSRDTSTPFSVPLEFENELLDFVSEGLAEDRLLLEALKRQPRFHSGGYILMFQPQAEAMTLDRDVFVEGPLSAATYVHEMVHVAQYGRLGPLRFLTLFFGETAAKIAWHFLHDLPFDPFKLSALERQAYAIQERFERWRATRKAAPREKSLSHVTAVPHEEPRRTR